MMHIEESGLYLGDYAKNDFFNIEKSQLYRSLGKGIKTVEFILRKNDNTVFFVEAKSSGPQPEKNEDFNTYIQEISDKIIHSNDLFFSVLLKRKQDEHSEFPSSFRKINYETAKITAILIINNFNSQWLSPIREALERNLKHLIKTWRFEIIVLNHEKAIANKLVKRQI
jgi:hypothetical protein